MEWLANKLTDLCRRWHDDGLPERLAFDEIRSRGIVRGAMARAARLAVSLDVPVGVFGIIGVEYARRASRTGSPRERLMMEDVSCAFHPIQTRVASRQVVPRIHTERLAVLLGRYLRHVGEPWPKEQVWEAIERYVAEHKRDGAGENCQSDDDET